MYHLSPHGQLTSGLSVVLYNGHKMVAVVLVVVVALATIYETSNTKAVCW